MEQVIFVGGCLYDNKIQRHNGSEASKISDRNKSFIPVQNMRFFFNQSKVIIPWKTINEF